MWRTVLLFAFCQGLLSCYSLRQVYLHGKLFLSKKSIEEILTEKSAPPEVLEKLRLVEEIKAFASERGLNVAGAYTHVVFAPYKEGVSFLVYAAPPFELKAKTYWFPFVGTVPYIGFYYPENRDQHAESLEKQGLEIYKATASAYSSLGWFEDPLYDVMLKRGEAGLAHLLFHELTHRTFWMPGSVELNENLAEFVADRMLPLYLEDRPELHERFRSGREDAMLFKRWLKEFRQEVAALYEGWDDTISEEQKLAEKKALFQTFQNEKAPEFKNQAYENIVKNGNWNNARILAQSLYEPDTELFEAVYRCRDFKNEGEFLATLKKELQTHELDDLAANCF